MSHKSNSSAYRFLTVVVLFLATIIALPLGWITAGGAAAPATQQRSASKVRRVISRTDKGTVVTASIEDPGPATTQNLNQLLSTYPGEWQAEITGGLVSSLRLEQPLPVTSSAKEFSTSFLSEFSTLFGIDSRDTDYLVEFSLSEKRVVEYRQTLAGVPVEHSFITFLVNKSGLQQITSRVFPTDKIGLISTSPALQKDDAVRIALADFGADSELTDEAELIILPKNDNAQLVWKLNVKSTSNLRSFIYYVDAQTAGIVEKYSNLIAQESGSRRQTALASRETTSAVLRSDIRPAEFPGNQAQKEKGGANELQGPPTEANATWETILSDNFDVRVFPYSPWNVFDNNGTLGGDIYWDDQNCVSHDPSWSLWAAAAGTNRLNACTNNYTHNMDSWAVYGPFDLSNATDGLLDFHYNNDSELNFDHFKWVASVNGTNFYGYQTSGNSNGWQYESLDLKNVPGLGNVTGRNQVWIAFVFSTDASVVTGKGTFVDDVAIKKLTGGACTGISGHVGGHIYGRNRFELQLRDFKNMKVVLDNTLAFDSFAVTNSVGNYSSSQCSDNVRFELEGHGSTNFVRVEDCNGGTCLFGGDLLASQGFPFSSSRSFDWNEADDNKKEVNVFWHVNEIHDWFKNLLGQDLMNYQMKAYVDYAAADCPNAFYYSSTKNIYFCPNTEYARESDVIYHEYTHGMVDHIANYFLPYQNETGAMNEGFADYYAAVKNNDTFIDGTNRNITQVVNYSDKCNNDGSACRSGQYWTGTIDFGHVHHNSLVVSGALWDLRQNRGLTGSFVDRLVFDTLMLRKPLGIVELLNGMVAQDGGVHESQIRAAFATRSVTSGGVAVGQGAPNPQLFVNAFNRSSFSQFVVMPPVNEVHRWNCDTCDSNNPAWGKGLIQDFNGTSAGVHNALMVADTNTNFVAQIYGGMWNKFIQLGGLNYSSANNRMLGYPTADRNCSDFNVTCFAESALRSPFGTLYHYQRFQGGSLVLHKSGIRLDQTFETHGPIRARWQVLGGADGSLGLPISDEYAFSSKRRSDFEGGSICFNPATNQTEDNCVASTTNTLSASPASVNAGATINVAWTASSNHSTSDWVGMFKVGMPNNSWVDYKYVPAGASGTLSFTAPQTAGSYEFRYLPNNGFTSTATSNAVTVGSISNTYTLTATPASVTPGGSIVVNWTAPSNHSASDWIGLYRPGTANTAYLDYKYVPSGSSGALSFVAPATSGVYEFRYLLNNGYVSTVNSNQITVGSSNTGSGYTVTATPSSVRPGNTISVNWTAPSGHSGNDWVGLYRVGAADTAFISFRYISTATSGTLNFVAPSAAGVYEFRTFVNNGYTKVATSNSVTVSP